jgi:hypothetical protein
MFRRCGYHFVDKNVRYFKGLDALSLITLSDPIGSDKAREDGFGFVREAGGLISSRRHRHEPRARIVEGLACMSPGKIRAGALAAIAVIGWTIAGYGQSTEKPMHFAAARTGKERLGDKASDEQRVDNCKVPAERRGPKPRPEDCRHGDRRTAPAE